jgi:rSAM/selenodomain-associated transferase 1
VAEATTSGTGSATPHPPHQPSRAAKHTAGHLRPDTGRLRGREQRPPAGRRPVTYRKPRRMDLLVFAKEPLPGRVKTRLCPPCTADHAAALATAALADTLAAACTSAADRVVLALDGRPGSWCPPGVDIVDQGRGDLATRLTQAWTATAGPALQIGMDTPQIGADVLDRAMATLVGPGVDAVLGPAADGGWWAIGLRRPHPRTFTGIPTSRPDTGARQADRLAALGLRTRRLAVHRDIDTWADALAVAETRPDLRFATTVRRVRTQVAGQMRSPSAR